MSVLCCIGSGNMGSALMKSAGRGADIYFTDADMEKAKSAAASLGVKTLNTNIEAAEKGDFIFLAVKPQVLLQVLAEIAPAAKKRQGGSSPVFISMAAGWSISKIQAALGEKLPVVRIMPNTPALIGKGMIALSASEEVTDIKAKELEEILKGAGVVDRIDERFMDAVTGLSGSGPAFVYLFIEALADGGIRAGLPEDKALRYAAQTVLGAAEMLKETGKQPGELIKMVTSPGGTTIAGLAVMEEGALRETVTKAVEAAYNRSIELGK